MFKHTLFPLALLLILSQASVAWSCSFQSLEEHSVDSELAATDTQAPGVAGLDRLDISRGVGPMQEGCDQVATSCDDLGLINIFLAPPSDDQSQASALGYMITLKDGALPGGLGLPEGPVRAAEDNSLYLTWIDGAQDKQEPLGFTLEIFAVDEAGNVGEPLEVRVSDPGSGEGCSAAPGQKGPLLPVLGLLLGLFLLGRRRRQ